MLKIRGVVKLRSDDEDDGDWLDGSGRGGEALVDSDDGGQRRTDLVTPSAVRLPLNAAAARSGESH